MIYRFANCNLDTERHELTVAGAPVAVEPQVFDLLVLLARNPGHLISKDELVEVIWGGRAISDSAITSRVNAARRAVGDDGFRQAVIATVPRRGIKLVAIAEGSESDTTMRVLRSSNSEPPAAPVNTTAQPVVGVLPFRVQGGDTDLAYLGNGMAEDIATELGRFRCVDVLAAYTTRRIGPSWDAQEGLKALGASHGVGGSLQVNDGRMRISVQLIELASLRLVWSERYDIGREEMFDVQDDVVSRIVGTLFGRLTDDRATGARKRPTKSLDAYDCVLRGMALHRSGHMTVTEAVEAIAWYERAIEIDPAYARAWAWRGCATTQKWPARRSPSYYDACLDDGRRAVDLDPCDAEGHRIVGGVHCYLNNFEPALHHLEQARELNPNDSQIRVMGGYYFSALGEREKGANDIMRSQELNPLHPAWYWRLAGCVHFDGGHDQAALDAFARLTERRDVDHAYTAACLVGLGETARAREEIERLRSVNPGIGLVTLADWYPFLLYRHNTDVERLKERLAEAGLR